MNLQKTYLSRAMTRAMALDHPIGDPTGGPAYGERNEPVSAVLAIGSMVAGYGAATAAGATMAAMVLGGMAMAGGALSLVGNVTGNAKLQKFGSIVGMVGGAGLTLGAMGAFSLTTTPAAGAAAGAGSTPTPEAPPAGSQAPVQNGVQTNAPPPMPEAPPPPAPNALDTPNPNAQALNTPTVNQAPPPPPTAELANSTNLAQAPAAAAGGQPTGQWMIDDQGSRYFMPNGGGVTPGTVAPAPDSAFGAAGAAGRPLGVIEGAWQGVKDVGGDFMKFTKDNPMGAYVAAQAVGGAADAMSGKSAAQKAQLQADAELRQAQADKTAYDLQLARDRIARLNAGYAQVNQGVSVNTNAVDPRTRFVMLPQAATAATPAGLIAGARG